jgi:hypothetical protein
MKSIRIPANLEAAKRANEIIQSKIDELDAESATRKKPSLRQELQKERLQGLLVTSTLNQSEIDKFGNLLKPEEFSSKASALVKQFNELSKEELVKRLAHSELELEIERGYAEITNRALDQFEHILDGDEYRKNKANNNRQEERNKNFAADNDYLTKTLHDLKKRKCPNPLTWDDFEIFQRDVHLGKPEPDYKQDVRVVGEAKDLEGEELQIHKDVTREDNPGWSKSRLRNFYTEKTGLTPNPE